MHEPETETPKDVLHIIHNAGFFSCSTIALQEIMMYYNLHGRLPDEVNRTQQYMYYKHLASDNLIPMLFTSYADGVDASLSLRLPDKVYMSDDNREQQFSDYKALRHTDLRYLINRYFLPSEEVTRRAAYFMEHYNFDPANTVGVFHRANDKVKETAIADDAAYISIAEQYKGKRFFVVPDNFEFLEAFKAALPDSFHIEANPCMHRDADKAIFMLVPPEQRPEHALNFLATVVMLSQCETLITHSGNGGFWACLYRGHSNNIHQYLNGEWL